MYKTKAAVFPSTITLMILALLLGLFFLMVSPSTVSAYSRRPPTRTTTEKESTSCTFQYVGDNAETCSGYSAFPCTCTINCPSCLQADDTCTGLSVNVINAICGNAGWQEADRNPVWRYYTVTHIRRYR